MTGLGLKLKGVNSMRTVTRSLTRCKTCGAGNLNQERLEWLADYLQCRPGGVQLDGGTYRYMKTVFGFSKSELDRSVAGLRDAGLVMIEGLTVIPIEAASCPVV